MEKLNLKINGDCLLSEKLYQLGFEYPQINKLLKKKDVKINERRISSDWQIFKGDELTIFYTSDMRKNYDIVFEDENIIILNKPYGIEVEGETGVANALNALAVHRLDRNTTGLMVLAKNIEVQKQLTEAFKNHLVIKKYLAEVDGKTNFKNYTFDAYLQKDVANSKVKIFTKKVANAEKISTTFTTIKSSNNSSLIECVLHTGKTHQIRASLAYLGHPIIGDGKYGKNEINKKFNEFKQRLSSVYLSFTNLTGILEYLNNREYKIHAHWIK